MALALTLASYAGATPRVALAVADRNLVQTVGPFTLAPGDMQQPVPATFVMPRDGWLGAYAVTIVDAAGHELPPTLLHHAELIDQSRRELFRPRIMRIASISHDTPELTLPAPIGYPVRRGQHLLVAPMLVNPLARPVTVYLRIRLGFRAAQPGSEITSVATFNFNTPGKSYFNSDFDLPAGRSVHRGEFEVPIAGRLLAVSGHLHRYATRMTLVRMDTGDTLFDWRPPAGAAGTAEPAPALRSWQTGLHLRAGTRLELVAVYDNPTGSVVADGGMATAGGVFLPDDWRRWPALDPRDTLTIADRERIAGYGMAEGMAGMKMN